jgi:pilus assembly protein CpaC
MWGVFAALLVCALTAPSSRAQSADNSVQVNVAQSVSLAVDNVTKLAVADPTVADVVPLSDKEVSIIGKKVGVTTLSVVRGEGRPTLIYRVEVGNDSAAVTIRQMVGSTNITVRAIGDTIVLSGTVEDEIEEEHAVDIATAYQVTASSHGQVLNLLEVSKPRQIKIRTRVAEVNTEAIKNIGLQWFGPQGQVQYGMQYLGGGSIVSGFLPPASEFGAVPTTITPNTVSMDVILDVLLSKSYAKLLSEPTLVTYSGKEASYLVGEEVPIVEQLPQSFTVEFKEVGVRMKIKPTADSQNRINTSIHAEVSEIIGTGASGLPIIGAKTADTTLQVNDGQTIVIGGLLANNINRDILRKLPWLGDIPVIGLLFRDKQFDQTKDEVLFFVTPSVIKDIDADTAAAAQSPVMQHWMNIWNRGGAIKPLGHDDWGLHNPDHLGFPYGSKEDKHPAKDAHKTSGSSMKQNGAADAPSQPGTNFEPARPSGN